jgi:hypothetical protein
MNCNTLLLLLLLAEIRLHHLAVEEDEMKGTSRSTHDENVWKTQDRRCKNNVTFWRVQKTIVAVETQVLHTGLCVCMCVQARV